MTRFGLLIPHFGEDADHPHRLKFRKLTRD